MKRNTLKRLAALVLAAALIALGIPASLADAPAGYNANEFEKLRAFLESADENGVKNGNKLTEDYDADDPERWGTYYDYVIDEECDCFVWQQIGGEFRIVAVNCSGSDLVGELDVSGFSELVQVDCEQNRITGLNVENCPKLRLLAFRNNTSVGDIDLTASPELEVVWGWEAGVTSIDVTNCPKLERLYLDDNAIGTLDVTNNPLLDTLNARNCGLSTIDLSNNPLLIDLDLVYNPLVELDVSNCPEIMGGRFAVEGSGSFSFCWFSWNEGFAAVNDVTGFIGWYDGTGALITSESGFDLQGTNCELAIARFEGAEGLAGDADGSGTVETADAALVLRHLLALDTSGHAGTIEANCDMNGDGAIGINDALLILRLALGLGA